MNYEQKYKEALKWMQGLYSGLHGATKEDAEHYFPELIESEDEKIRKAIIAYIDHGQHNGVSNKDMIAWLEKQSEKNVNHIGIKEKAHQIAWETSKDYDPLLSKESWCEMAALDMASWLEKQGKQTHAELCQSEVTKTSGQELEPKFKVGDWCIDNEDDTIFQIVKVLDNTYTYRTNEGKEYSCTHYSLENDVRLWTIQDAKDGDVLYSPCCKLLWIYKDEKTCHAGSNLNYSSGSIVINKPVCIPNDVQPATKEQRDLLFQKMKEACYEWDADEKELKKIENEIEIPFGAKDSELQEATYYIPKGFYAAIDDDKVVIKKDEESTARRKQLKLH